MDLSKDDIDEPTKIDDDTCADFKKCDEKCYPKDDYLLNKYVDTNFDNYKKVPSVTLKKYKNAVKDNFNFFFKTNDFWLWLGGGFFYLLSIMICFSIISILIKFFLEEGREYRKRFIFLMIILGLVLIAAYKLDL